MPHTMKYLLMIVSLSLTAACAAPPLKNIDVTPPALSHIRSVAVIRPPEMKIYAVINLGHPGRYLGLFGQLAAGSNKIDMEAKLAQALEPQKLSIHSALADNLAANLSRLGFEARTEDGQWKLEGKIYVLGNHPDADAVVVISTRVVGFVAEGANTDYVPTILAMATLSDRSQTVIYRRYHAAGYHPNEEGWRHTSANVTFPNFESLMASPVKTGDSLNAAASAIASTIAADLRR